MTSGQIKNRAEALWLAAGFGFALVLAPTYAAFAQSAQEQAASESAEAATAEEADDEMAEIDVNKLDWSQLNVDAATLSYNKAPRAPAGSKPSEMAWSNKDKPNGASAVSVKQSVTPFWDTRIGADMTVTRQPTTMSELLAEKSSNGGNLPQSTGSAWAAATAPGAGQIWDKTAVEARVDPGSEQSKIGASLTKSVPLSGDTSLTLQNGYSVNQQGTTAVPGIGGHITRNYETDQSAKVTITDTGTSITAGQTLSTTDDKWLRKVGAEQKLFDNVTVSGSVGETSQGAINKSLTAGFKKSW